MSPSDNTLRAAAMPTPRGVYLFLALIALVAVRVALAVYVWGPVALTMAALPLVPLIFAAFIWISLP